MAIEKIGRKIVKLESLKADHQARTIRLTRKDIDWLLEMWGDVAFVAEALDVGTKVVNEWIRDKKLKAWKGPDGRWYIPLEQLREAFTIKPPPKRQQLRAALVEPLPFE